jgi:nitrate reductase NapAB chaperone NapD
MKTININVPEGHVAKQQETKDGIVITFEKEALENIMERVKTFRDACNVLNIRLDSVYSFGETADEIAYKKLKVIVKALNEGWTPNWDDTNEKKWWPWFKLSSGFGFATSYCAYASTRTDVGSRLCFRTEELSDYAATQFIDLYKDLLTL